LVLLDSSDIATPSGMGSFYLKVDFVTNFDFSGLGASSFHSVRISAQCTSGAHFVAPEQCATKDLVQIGLQRKYSFDSVPPGSL
jgi:hypothetical protein